MNPIKPITDTIRFFYDDLKTDIKFIIKIFKKRGEGETILRPEYKAELKRQWKEFSFYDFLKAAWMIYLLLGLAFASGWWVQTQRLQNECNVQIYENYIRPIEMGQITIINNLNSSTLFNHRLKVPKVEKIGDLEDEGEI